MAGRHSNGAQAPLPGDEVIVEFVDAPQPDTREIMIIPPAGIPLRLERDGIDYGLAQGHEGQPVTYDYLSVDPA